MRDALSASSPRVFDAKTIIMPDSAVMTKLSSKHLTWQLKKDGDDAIDVKTWLCWLLAVRASLVQHCVATNNE